MSTIRVFNRLNPLQEEFHEMLLRAYAEMGNRTAIMEHYGRMESLFLEELGLELRASTKALYEQLLEG